MPQKGYDYQITINTTYMKNKNTVRKFESGATRDTADGKLNYYGFRHPLLEQSFAYYMHEHRKQTDGSIRDANNWWKGWDKEISLQSLIRHTEDLQAINSGYLVFELRYEDGSVGKEYVDGISEANDSVKSWKEMGIAFKWVTVEETLNAIRFNTQSYLLQVLARKD